VTVRLKYYQREQLNFQSRANLMIHLIVLLTIKSDNIEEFLESRSDLVDRVFQLKNASPEDSDCEKRAMVERLKDAIENGVFGQKASDSVGICSLSRSPLNLLMWAHYANDHKGFVVEFDIPLESFFPIKDEVKFLEWLIPQKVEYQEFKPVVNFSDDQETKMKKQFFNKRNRLEI
jgi:hypothetical protein